MSEPHPAPGIDIRPATPADVAVLLDLIRGLARYERLEEQLAATEDLLRTHLFDRPAAEAWIAWDGDRPAGYALAFATFSTFLARPGLWLEDLFVCEDARGRGIGRRLLAHVAARAAERGCGRLEWSVLDWNEPAIEFYRRAGAEVLDNWRICRVTGDALRQLTNDD